MANATLPTPVTRPLLLVRGLLRPTGDAPTAGAHLHFDRDARVWRSHDERHAVIPVAAPSAASQLAECA